MKLLGTAFFILLLSGCYRTVPQYYQIDDCIFEVFNDTAGSQCKTLTKAEKINSGKIVYLLILPKIVYVNKYGQNGSFFYEPGGYGRSGILQRIKDVKVVLRRMDFWAPETDVSKSLYRDSALENVTVSGKGFAGYLYDARCSALGLSDIWSLSDFAAAVNRNDQRLLQGNLLSTKGIGLVLNLKGIPQGRHALVLTIGFAGTERMITKSCLLEVLSH